jgi:hypothetical protein
MTRAKRPDPLIEMPDRLVVSKVGLGYVGSLMPAGVVMSIDRLVQQRGELLGELTVERAPEGHVFIGRFNLSSIGMRRQTAEYLSKRTNNVSWSDALEDFCLFVLRAEREGSPFELLGREIPDQEVKFMLWPLLPDKRATVIFGEGGVGKSTLATAAAVMVASGQVTVPGWRVDTSGPVLVIDWEADRPEWDSHVAAVSRGIGIAPPKNIHYRAGAGPLTDQLDDVAQHIAQHDVALLIIDSVGLALPSRAEGADANEAALKLFAALRYLGITTLLIDHVAGADMGAERAILKPYGSVYKFNLARNLFELRGMPPTADGVMHLALYHRKSNRTAKLGPMGLGVHHGPGELLFMREELEAAEANAAIPLHSRIYTLLLAGGKDVRTIADAVNSSPNTVRATLSRMATLGMAMKLPGNPRNPVWVVVAGGERTAQAPEAQHQAQHAAPVPVTADQDDQWG